MHAAHFRRSFDVPENEDGAFIVDDDGVSSVDDGLSLSVVVVVESGEVCTALDTAPDSISLLGGQRLGTPRSGIPLRAAQPQYLAWDGSSSVAPTHRATFTGSSKK